MLEHKKIMLISSILSKNTKFLHRYVIFLYLSGARRACLPLLTKMLQKIRKKTKHFRKNYMNKLCIQTLFFLCNIKNLRI